MALAKGTIVPSQLKDVDFSCWQQVEMLESLKQGDKLNEVACTMLLEEFSKLLQWYCQLGTLDQITLSQMLCYTDRLAEVFNNPSVSTKAAKLLLSKRMKLLRSVMNLSLCALGTTPSDLHQMFPGVVFDASPMISK